MSFKISGPGFYRQRNGGKAEVKFIDGDFVYGRNSRGASCMWKTVSGVESNEFYERKLDLIAPWSDAPDPGEGWRLLERDEYLAAGDEYFNVLYQRWQDAGGAYTHTAGSHIDRGGISAYRRRVPPPLRISDKGCGIYETRDGRQERVTERFHPLYGGSTWGSGDGKCAQWFDSGSRNGLSELPGDLVRYIGPLAPLPEPEQWVATCELRKRQIETPTRGAQWVHAENSDRLIGRMILVIQEQRFTCNGRDEWRPVPVTA